MDEDVYQKMEAKWPSSIVARSEIKKFTGGGISPKTVANADSIGRGPKDRFYLGKNTCYPVSSVIEWLKQKSKEVKNG